MTFQYATLTYLFLSLASPFVMAQNSNVDQEIIIQRLLDSLEDKDHQDALLQIDRLRQIDPMLSGEILYYEANSANATGNKKRADRAAREYVQNVGKNGSNYSAALSLLAELQREFEAQEAIRLKQEQEQQLLRKAAEEAERNRQAAAEAERLRQLAIAAEANRQRQAAQEAENLRIARIVEPAVKSIIASMKEIPGGTFMMGSESPGNSPMRQITIKPFRMMEHEVTYAQWDACAAAGACRAPTDIGGWGRGDRPVMRITGEEVLNEFIPWLNKTTGQIFRLPTESEWEYAARAGTKTKFSWGDDINCSQARYGLSTPWVPDSTASCSNESGTVPVKSFSPNPFGLFDMHGNVAEMVQDCTSFGMLVDNPTDGSSGTKFECIAPYSRHIVRGGAWFSKPDELRSAYRRGYAFNKSAGFRLVQDN